jgi:hypothetical protein
MMTRDEASWPKDLVLLRWAFTVAALVCAGQWIAMFLAHRGVWEPNITVVYGSTVTSLTCGACVQAWRERLRGFVLLALLGQVINGFTSTFLLLGELSVVSEVPEAVSRHLIPKVIWSLIVVAFSSTVVMYLTPRYVSIRGR